MTESGWQAIGRIARLRRERLGLKQEDLARYGGPGVSTVGKFERAAQESFPLRTQHQMENALGWSRTIVEQVVNSIEDGSLKAEDWEYDLVHEDVPDLSRGGAEGARYDDANDPEFAQRVEAMAGVLRLVPVPDRDQATGLAVGALLTFLTPAENRAVTFDRLSVAPDRTDTSIAADEGESPIERGQGHDEHP